MPSLVNFIHCTFAVANEPVKEETIVNKYKKNIAKNHKIIIIVKL